MEICQSRESTCVLDLPIETKLDVIDLLDRKRDIYNLSLACGTFQDVTFSRLHRDVDIEIPLSRGSSWNIETLPVLRTPVIQSIRNLLIRDGAVDKHELSHDRKRKSDALTVDDYVCNILTSIPAQQLLSFDFYHRDPLSDRVFESIESRHGQSLRRFGCYELKDSSVTKSKNLNRLESFECRSTTDGSVLGKLITANSQSLRSLRLGQERSLVEQYRRSRIAQLGQTNPPENLFGAILHLQDLHRLCDLALFGIDLTTFVPATEKDALYFCQLETLTLESCTSSNHFLSALADTFGHVQRPAQKHLRVQPALKEFYFRHENPTTPLKDALIDFLASFTGLTTLSILLENATFLDRPSVLINTHGPTLRTLVLESRIQPREHLGLDTSRPFGIGGYSQQLWDEAISDICNQCPNLTELGGGFPWNDEMVLIRKSRTLASLQHLRTMHVRNFPENSALSQVGDYSIKEYAQKYIDWVYPGLIGGPKPALETLSIGPTVYESRWRGISSDTNRREPPEFLRTHHFCLDWAKTRFGRWSALVTPVKEKYMEEMREQKPLEGVFKQVWLR